MEDKNNNVKMKVEQSNIDCFNLLGLFNAKSSLLEGQ